MSTASCKIYRGNLSPADRQMIKGSEIACTMDELSKATLAVLGAEKDRLARQLPEYETVRAMYGVAELGDVRRFPHRSSIVSFAGGDPAQGSR